MIAVHLKLKSFQTLTIVASGGSDANGCGGSCADHFCSQNAHIKLLAGRVVGSFIFCRKRGEMVE